jgi:hypothetical protein
VLAAQARARYNKAQFRQIFALADVGRVMAQGFCARLAEGVCRPYGSRPGRLSQMTSAFSRALRSATPS